MSTAALALDLMSSPCATMPPTTITRMTTPSTRKPSRTRRAPPMRGTPFRCSQLTAGADTVARTRPISTGSTITDVIASSATMPTRNKASPTSSHDAMPMSRSHRGAANTADSSRSWLVSSLIVCGSLGTGSAPPRRHVPPRDPCDATMAGSLFTLHYLPPTSFRLRRMPSIAARTSGILDGCAFQGKVSRTWPTLRASAGGFPSVLPRRGRH